MKESLLEILRCPLDKHELELEDAEYADDGEEVVSGVLVCSECGERYPIEDGIPNLLPPDMREETPA
ncbi:methytransferase partner Trm112 [Natrarchaeobius chitinivorans]|uniref:Trm112 family protein n=1 Tax=Natrarchaeobius chitinivorans TaxID=1679083 RepID=A0A3N6LRV1_NATCH|nr:methytransferase partner Trm112 [Natrarchaeobius chitinivorans]RQG92543.1 Trm112 family protein [Natrarchaeobius chitinivorans]